MTAWTDFIKKIFAEGRKKNPEYQFKDAMKEASKRKGEMGSSAVSPTKSTKKRGKSKSKSRKSKKGGKSRRKK